MLVGISGVGLWVTHLFRRKAVEKNSSDGISYSVQGLKHSGLPTNTVPGRTFGTPTFRQKLQDLPLVIIDRCVAEGMGKADGQLS